MATEVSHYDAGDGTVVVQYDDGSQDRWYIDHPEWGTSHSDPPQRSSSGSYGGSSSSQQQALDDYRSSASELAGIHSDEFNRTLELQQQQAEQSYKVQLMNAKTAQERAKADEWYQRQQVGLGLLAHEMQRSQLGLNYLQTAVQYASSPDNYFKLLDFKYGASQRQDVPLALQSLLTNQQAPAFQAQGGKPDAKTITGLLGALGYSGGVQQGQNLPTITPIGVSAPPSTAVGAPQVFNQQGAQPQQGQQKPSKDPRTTAIAALTAALPPSGTPGYSQADVNALNTIMDLYHAPQNIAPGQWESTPDTAKKLTLAGVARGGGDPSLFLDSIRRSRPNLGAASAA